ncbi:MAG TPA: glycosyltransferase family 39 protein [Gemmataceae bacterium]|nr:glycosyltransferase family 39 protein [Gemmataceae bacterium]
MSLATAPRPAPRAPSPPAGRRPLIAWACALCVALGLAARAAQFGRGLSYWYDEAYLLLNVFHRDCLSLLGAIDHNVPMPPLFLWLMRGVYLLGGAGEWVMRLPAAVAGVAAVVLMVPLARRVVGGTGWALAVCFVALSRNALLHGAEVRPYTLDLLLTEAILLATLVVLGDSSPRARQGAWAALWALALAGPWLSFPSAFGLGGASAALFWANRKGASRAARLAWLALNALTALSGALLWYFSARHLYYPGLTEHWAAGWSGFPDWSRPGAALLWLLTRLSTVAGYGTDDMGVPVALLAVVGFVVLARTRPAVAVGLVVPLLLALGAACLGKYPLADRTALFAAPCAWLPAAVGVEALRRSLFRRWPAVALLVPAVLLAPGVIHMSKLLVVPRPNTAFREAFAFVEGVRRPDDVLFVSHVEVYEVYCGREPPALGAGDLDRLGEAARHNRVWLVRCLSPMCRGGPCLPEAEQRVEEAGGRPTLLRRDFQGLEVALYEPDSSLRAKR